MVTMKPSGWHHPDMDNTCTLYLGDKHCLVGDSVAFCFCFSFYMCLSVNFLSVHETVIYIGQTGFREKTYYKLLFQTSFKNPHKNWARNNGILLKFQFTLSAIISIGIFSFKFQTTLGAQPGVRSQKNRIFKLEGSLTSLKKFVPLHTEKYFWDFVDVANVNKMTIE